MFVFFSLVGFHQFLGIVELSVGVEIFSKFPSFTFHSCGIICFHVHESLFVAIDSNIMFFASMVFFLHLITVILALPMVVYDFFFFINVFFHHGGFCMES